MCANTGKRYPKPKFCKIVLDSIIYLRYSIGEEMAVLIREATENEGCRVEKLGTRSEWSIPELIDLVGGTFFAYQVERFGQQYQFVVCRDTQKKNLNSLAMWMALEAKFMARPESSSFVGSLQGPVVILNPTERIGERHVDCIETEGVRL